MQYCLILTCRLATRFDIVITTYRTLNADFQRLAERKKEGGGRKLQPLPVVNHPSENRFPPLGSIKWHRCVTYTKLIRTLCTQDEPQWLDLLIEMYHVMTVFELLLAETIMHFAHWAHVCRLLL